MISYNLSKNKVINKLFIYKSYIYIYILTGFGIKKPMRVDIPYNTNQPTNQPTNRYSVASKIKSKESSEITDVFQFWIEYFGTLPLVF